MDNENDLEQEEVVEETEKDEVQLSIEARARRMGWRPLEEYSGNKDRWVEASVFVERGENELPILRERFRKLDDRLANTEKELSGTKVALDKSAERLKESTDVLLEMREMAKASEERGYLRAKAEVDAKEAKAFREADEAGFIQARQEREILERSRTPAAAPKPPVQEQPVAAPVQGDPRIDRWVKDNPWFTNDRLLNQVAIGYDMDIKQEFPHWSVEEQLDEVKKRVLEKFPEKFGNVRRAAPAAVSGSSAPRAPRPKGKTVADLPADAKAALAKIKKTMPDYQDAEYLKLYFGAEA